MGGSRATFAGKPIVGSISWGLSSGTSARTAVVNMTHRNAAELLGSPGIGGAITGGGPASASTAKTHTLKLGAGGRDGTFEGLYILHEVAAPSPKWRSFLIADRRWLWPNAVYRRSINERRVVGTTRLLSPDQLDRVDLAPDLAYKVYSLRNQTTPWTATDLLRDLADEVQRWESQEGGASPNVVVPAIGPGADLPIQDLELDGSLDSCIERVMAYLPGLDVTVDANGDVRFFWRTGTEESEQIAAAGPEVKGGGHVQPVSFKRTRPRKVRVYFTLHVEARIDTEELASTSSTSAPDPDGWTADNVLPVPDYELALTTGATVTTGTWVTFPVALASWGAPPGVAGALDFPLIRRAMAPGNSLANMFEEHGRASPDQDWVRRGGVIEAHYRRTFRVNPRIMDRVSNVRASRVATINPEQGTRGRASVWSDFAYLPTGRSRYAEYANSAHTSAVMNCACYPSSGLISGTPAAPASVTIDDADQGIYTITYEPTPTRLYVETLPSQVETQGANTQPGTLVAAMSAGPSPYLRRSTRAIGWNIIGRFQSPAELTANHKTITILTVVPAAPNTKRAMCWVDVTPGDVPSFPGQGECEGPMLEIRVGPGLEVGRMAWLDSRKDELRAAITSDDARPVTGSEVYALADLVTNYNSGGAGGNAASLTSIARACAARVWHSMRDRQLGAATFRFTPGAQLAGALTEIEHELSMTGALTTRMSLPARIEGLDLTRYTDAATRRVLFRTIAS